MPYALNLTIPDLCQVFACGNALNFCIFFRGFWPGNHAKPLPNTPLKIPDFFQKLCQNSKPMSPSHIGRDQLDSLLFAH